MKSPSDTVAVFWDYENCPAPSNASALVLASNIFSLARPFGSIKVLKAYLGISDQSPLSRSVALRSELQSSGVTLVDCPHNGKKEVADKMIIVDMLAFAIDNPAPCTIVLITGDRDFSYALSILKLRQYRAVLVTLPNAHPSLRFQAHICFDWFNDVVYQTQTGAPNSPEVRKSRPFERSRPSEPVSDSERSSFLDTRIIDSADTDTDEYADFEEYLRNRAKQVPIFSQIPSPVRTSPGKRRRYISRSPPTVTRAALLSPTQRCSSTSFTEPSQGSAQPDSPATPRSRVTGLDSFTMSLLGGRVSSLPSVSKGKTVEPEWPLPVGSVELSDGPSAWSHSNGMKETIALAIQDTHGTPSLPQTPLNPRHLGSAPTAVTETSLNEDLHTTSHTLNEECENTRANTPFVTPPCIPNILPEVVYSTSAPGNVFSDDVSSIKSSRQETSVVNIPPHIPIPSATTSSTLTPATGRPVIPPKFTVLVQTLQWCRSKGALRPLRSDIAMQIAKQGTTYRNAGVTKFRQYMNLAEKAGIVELGGTEGEAWVGLMSQWVDGVTDETF